MQAQMTDGGSGGSNGGSQVLVNFAEMVDIATRLQNIYNLYSDGVAKNIDNLANCDFYRQGEATRVVKQYKDILGKTMELADNYQIAALAVNYTLEEMIKKDEELQRILSVSG
ncbi:hypothetical protein [Bacillus sp. BP-3]|uniref:hypothetical protein n=1 Tax=Bacillus sp. BP-3 TaxID=3022773 RepID=UPI00232FFCDA|nr:hypothetical protein [Bacillus sp. BP-3]MDC2866675.1 hypothetical protein [Bacillus sp. BP-3]